MSKLSVAFSAFLGASSALSQEQPQWQPLIVVTSASLASEQAQLLTSTGLSWSDGRQAVVTFWRVSLTTYRCADYFDGAMQQTGAYATVLAKFRCPIDGTAEFTGRKGVYFTPRSG